MDDMLYMDDTDEQWADYDEAWDDEKRDIEIWEEVTKAKQSEGDR